MGPGADQPVQLDGLPSGHAVAHRPGDREAHASEMEQGGADLERSATWRTPSYSTVSPVIHSAPCSWPSQARAKPITALRACRVGGGSLWVANHDERSVARIDLASGKVVADISVPSEPHRVTYGAGALWVGNWHDDSVSRIDPATNQVVPTSRSASQPPGHERPRPPHARPCRPAGRPQPWLARSTPPAGGSPASARSRSVRCKPAHDSATGACAIRAPPGGHRSAGRAPALRGGRGGWPAHRSPHSRSPWPWS
jgi:hypothetical protein